MSMSTFFLIKIEGIETRLGKGTFTIGTYISFQEASNIMLEHIGTILKCEQLKFTEIHKLYIEEVMPYKDQYWLPIRIRAEDKSIQEEYDKSVSE